MQDQEPFQILLVEDNPDDVAIVRRALTKSDWVHELQVAEDGQQALELLSQGVRPDLILLDLHLPKVGGHEVLATIAEHPDLGRIPIVVMTISNAVRDIVEALQRGAKDYLLKEQSGGSALVRSVREVVGEERRVTKKKAA